MRLGQLIDKTTYAALMAVTVAPWHERPDAERMQAVSAHCQDNAKKIGQFLDKKARMACREEIPHGRKMMTGWVESHAAALAQANPKLQPEAAMKQSLYDVLKQYGYGRPHRSFTSDFDRFQVR